MTAATVGLDEALELVKQSVALICHVPIASLTATTGPADVRGWDSFGRLQVVLDIERRLARSLPLQDMVALRSIGDLADMIAHLPR